MGSDPKGKRGDALGFPGIPKVIGFRKLALTSSDSGAMAALERDSAELLHDARLLALSRIAGAIVQAHKL